MISDGRDPAWVRVMIDLGDVYSTGFEVKDAAGALVNPATKTCTIILPDGTTATPTLTNPATGLLRLDFPTTQEGRHSGKVVTTTPDGAQPFEFDVSVSTTIVSLAETRAKLNFDATTSDDEVRGYMEAATDFVEGIAGAVVRRTYVEHVTPNRNGAQLSRWPVLALTEIVAEYGYDLTYDVAMYHVTAEGLMRPNYGGTLAGYPLKVTYVAGRAVVPALIRQAALDYIRWDWESQRPADSRFTRFTPNGEDFPDSPTPTPPYKIAAKLSRYAQPVVA